MKYTLAKADYNKDTKISTVVIKTDIGEFIGESKCHDEDLPFESQYFGCQIAEWKAIRKYCKAKRLIIAKQLDALLRFKSRMRETRGYDGSEFWIKIYTQTFDEYQSELLLWANNIERANTAIVTSIESRDVGLKKMYKELGKK